MQEAMDKAQGVVSTKVGYTGGEKKDPTYQEVSSGKTGHAEAIEVLFDPKKTSYEQVLNTFWKNIDPTVKDQQFCDKGKQYRSAIFYLDHEQKKLAQESRKKLMRTQKFDHIYTEIEQAGPFYQAEEYHQNYYKKNPYRYKIYKYLCGREQRLEKLWAK